jgi:hypothetical protein
MAKEYAREDSTTFSVEGAPKMGSRVIGYILRNESSAKINLSESDKIVDYAIFNSQLIESGQSIAELLGIQNVQRIIVEGKNIKTICKISGENKTCVFLNKTATR